MITRVCGVARPVEEPRPGRMHLGEPPGGPWVREGVWALRRALGPVTRPIEVVGAVDVQGPGWWWCRGVLARVPGPARLSAEPVGYWADDPDGRGVPPPARTWPAWVDLLAGPDVEAFPRDAFRRLVEGPWVRSARSDRMGHRLEGPALPAPAGSFPTGPMVAGAVEVPPDGSPIVLGPDFPVTGGYPVLAVVPPYARDVLGSAPTGGEVRFRAVDRERARQELATWWSARVDPP